MHCFKNTEKGNCGFGIIEILIASAVIVIAVGGITALMTSSIKANRKSANQVIAAYLAKEGVILFEHVREQNIKNGNRYDYSFESGGSPTPYTIDFIDDNRRGLGDFSGHNQNTPRVIFACNLTDGTLGDLLDETLCRLYTQPAALWFGITLGPCYKSYFHNYNWSTALDSETLCYSSPSWNRTFTPTPFYREIVITNITDPAKCPQPNSPSVPGCKKIASTVAWREGSGAVRFITATGHLYDWRK